MNVESLSERPTQIVCWILPIALTVSAFGPYIFTYFRTEHFVIYGCLFFSIIVFVSSQIRFEKSLELPTSLLLVGTLLFTTIVWTGLATILSNETTQILGAISNAENYIQPIAVLVIIAMVGTASRFQTKIHLKSVLFVLLGLLVLNTIFALAMIVLNTEPLANYFVVGPQSSGIDDTVWWRARTLGRYSGIFNQPYEAGLMYSLGIFGFIYLVRSNVELQLRHHIMGIIVVIGGFLPVSKVYIIVGLPLSLLFLLMTSRKVLVSWRTIVVGIVIVPAMSLLLAVWQGGDRVLMFIPSRSMSYSELLSLYTAGRLNQDSYVIQMIIQTTYEAPIFGYGFGYTGLFDSGYLEFYVQGGGIALLLYFLILYVIFRNGMWALEQVEGKLLIIIAIFTVVLSIGIPVLTVNRFSPVFWTVIGLLMYSTIDR